LLVISDYTEFCQYFYIEYPIQSCCHCLKQEPLPVLTILLMQNIITQCAQFRPTGNSYDLPPITHSSVASELLNLSMRCLSKSAQNLMDDPLETTMSTAWHFRKNF